MKKHKVWRFNCDFCSKGWFKEQKCLAHERRCVQNRNRICEFCERNDLVQQPLSVLMDLLERVGLDIDELRHAALDCPMCMLAAVMATNKEMGAKRGSEEWWYFDYAAELKRFDEKHAKEEII